MALNLITNPPSSLTDSSQWTDFVERSSKNMLGYGGGIPTFTLTNWDSGTDKPQIASGTIIEVGGSFYQADSDTALTDDAGLTDGICHIKLVPSAEATPLTVTPTLTNDVIPAWDANKVGWYDSNVKFLPHEMTKTGAVYSEKKRYVDQEKKSALTPLGYDNISAKDIVANNVTSENVTATNLLFDGFTISAGDTSISDATAEGNESSLTTVKVREFLSPGKGTIRTKFSIRGICEAQVYVNGIAVGTLRSVNSGTFVEYTEDISVESNDLIQLYGKRIDPGAFIHTGFQLFTVDLGLINRICRGILQNV